MHQISPTHPRTVWPALRAIASAAAVGMATLLLVGCPGVAPIPLEDEIDVGGGGETPGGGGGPAPPVASQLFAAAADPAWVIFRTNDPAQTGSRGRTHWHIGNQSVGMGAMEAEAVKISGDPGMGYGIVFAMPNVGTFLTVLITTERTYQIGKFTTTIDADGTTYQYTVINEQTDGALWTATTSLFRDYGRGNRIRVEYQAATREYALWFNREAAGDPPEVRFTDPTPDTNYDPAAGSFYGHIVSLAPDEGFPHQEVQVDFRQITPADIGFEPPPAAPTAAPPGAAAMGAAAVRSGAVVQRGSSTLFTGAVQ